jgi:hypothetical protein
MGALGGVPPQQIGGGIARYVVRGIVRDDQGNPIEGAAVELGGEMVFTNSSGEFLLRTKSPRRWSLSVRTGDFLLPGLWEVSAAPAEVTSWEENRPGQVEIILRQPAPPAP